MAYLIKFTVGGFCRVFIIVVSEFTYLYFAVWIGCEGWLYVGGGPKMHNIFGLSRVGHLHLGR
jgi:hypothetical protein